MGPQIGVEDTGVSVGGGKPAWAEAAVAETAWLDDTGVSVGGSKPARAEAAVVNVAVTQWLDIPGVIVAEVGDRLEFCKPWAGVFATTRWDGPGAKPGGAGHDSPPAGRDSDCKCERETRSAPCCTFSMSVVEPGEPGDEAPPATRDSSSDSECENDTRTPIVKRSESHLDAAHAVGGRSWASRALRFVAQDAAVMRECGWLLARSVAASLAAATPRCIALALIATSVRHTPLPQAQGDFKAMWAPCQDDTSSYSGLGPDGQFYKWLRTTDIMFLILSAWMCVSACLYIWFTQPGDSARLGTWDKKMLRAAMYLTVAVVFVAAHGPIATLLALHRNEIDYTQTSNVEGLAALRQVDLALSTYNQITGFVFFIACGAASLFRWSRQQYATFESCKWRRRLSGTIWRISYVAVVYGGFEAWRFLASTPPEWPVWQAMMVPMLWTKASTVALRFLLMRDLADSSEAKRQICNIFFFTLNYFTESYLRTKSWPAGTFRGSGVLGENVSNALVVSMVLLAAEALAFATACWANMQRSYQRLRGINSDPLDGLLESHRLLQRQSQVFYGQFAMSQLAAICVCIQIAMYTALSMWRSQSSAWPALAYGSSSHVWGAISSLVLPLTLQVCALRIHQCARHLTRACHLPRAPCRVLPHYLAIYASLATAARAILNKKCAGWELCRVCLYGKPNPAIGQHRHPPDNFWAPGGALLPLWRYFPLASVSLQHGVTSSMPDLRVSCGVPYLH